ncbi:MAG: hypothetical protein ACTSYA_07525 [Candidatus Kariarchaeaceae archaeon]
MAQYQLSCRNSMILPSTEEKIEIDTAMTLLEFEEVIRSLFTIKKKVKFVIFIKSNKKWHFIKQDLENYTINKNSKIEIRRFSSTDKLRELRKTITVLDQLDTPLGTITVDDIDPEKTRLRLVESARDFLEQVIQDPYNASFQIPSRSTGNIGFDENTEMVLLGRQMIDRQFRSLASVKSVSQMALAMRLIHDLLHREITSTKRDLFYMDVNKFESQNTSDSLIEDVGAMLKVTRQSLNVSASSKGSIIGNISYREKGDLIDCRKVGTGKSIAPKIGDIEDLESDAEFVLVIEKDAVFNRLAEDQFYDQIPSILITAKGQPDMATRMFLKRINDELKIPILAMMDADIYGVEIMRVYTIGSKSLSFESSHMAVPNIKWVGLLPSDLQEDSPFKIPRSALIKMTSSDVNRTKGILQEEYIARKPAWKKELEILLDLNYKAEIQALNAKDPQYITNHYLPAKLEAGDWI